MAAGDEVVVVVVDIRAFSAKVWGRLSSVLFVVVFADAGAEDAGEDEFEAKGFEGLAKGYDGAPVVAKGFPDDEDEVKGLLLAPSATPPPLLPPPPPNRDPPISLFGFRFSSCFLSCSSNVFDTLTALTALILPGFRRQGFRLQAQIYNRRS